MNTYGHPIRFGVQIVGDAQTPRDPVEVAILAEELGYEVVVFKELTDDAGPDVLSLSSWAAARTARIQIAPWIRALPRPASIVARTTSSLQLLSGHRAVLVLEPADASADVAALDDAIAVIRSLQDTTQRSRVSHHGAHHRLSGAERGPSLEWAVPLWVAGGTSAVAASAGRVADGWLTDLDDVGVEGFAELTKVLDAAAVAAGREPREIRRAVVLDSDTLPGVSSLIDLVVEHGVSSFVLRVGSSADDVNEVRSFMAVTAVEVRAAVERALPPGTLAPRPLRRADIRTRRSPGIAYDDVPADLAELAVEPGDAGFARVRSTYLRGGKPGLVLRPRSVPEVVSAVAFAGEHRHLPLGLRSGGHGISGRSTNDGGLVIDVGRLDDITVLDESARLVRVGAGARWRDVATALQSRGWALSSGDYGGVGVGGLATAGGIGFLNRKHGLTIDHLRAVEMVLADGSVVRASDTENPDLFWAVRGAGANFGVAVAFEFVVDEVADVGWAQLVFEVADPAAFLEAFGRVALATPRETTPFVTLGHKRAQLMAMVDSTDPEVIINQLQPFADLAPMVQQEVVIAPYAAVLNMFPASPHDGRGEPVSRSALVRDITPGFASASADLIRSGASHWYQIRTVGGAVADVAPDATAYAHRDANFSLAVMGASAERLDAWFDPIRRESDGLYLSFESDRRPERIADAFPPATLERLRRLKAQLDPHNVFQDNFNVTLESARSAS